MTPAMVEQIPHVVKGVRRCIVHETTGAFGIEIKYHWWTWLRPSARAAAQHAINTQVEFQVPMGIVYVGAW